MANKKKVKKNISKPKKSKPASSKSLVKNSSAKKVKTEKAPLVLQTLRGMKDILPADQLFWNHIRRVLSRICQEYGFSRIDLPIVEHADLFIRSVGEGTDIVDKEMYIFNTKGGDRVALRPEFTAGIARAYIQHGMNVLSKPIKLFTTGPLYRYDRPQEGRYREFWQADFEILGEENPILDAELIQLAHRVVTSLGLKSIQFQVNSIGCMKCRKDYQNLLVSYLESRKQKLCQDCKRRLETNPLRVLDCKEDKCMQVADNAPQTVDHLCTECHLHFKNLLEYLDELNLPYVLNNRLVRGLDYYTRTVFEIWTEEEGGKKYALGGGGRYDNLIKTMGSEQTPAIGFGLGLERIVAEMKRLNTKVYREPKPRVFLAKKKSLNIFAELQKNGILTSESFGRGSLKSQLRAANRFGVDITLIVGHKEALDKTVIVKDMISGTQETVTNEKLIQSVKKILKNNMAFVHNGIQNANQENEEEEDENEER
jgi:histidyl-tRNA synthetase